MEAYEPGENPAQARARAAAIHARGCSTCEISAKSDGRPGGSRHHDDDSDDVVADDSDVATFDEGEGDDSDEAEADNSDGDEADHSGGSPPTPVSVNVGVCLP